MLPSLKSLTKFPKFHFFFNNNQSNNSTLYSKCGGKHIVDQSMKDFKMLLRSQPELEHYFLWKDERKYIPGSQAFGVNSLGGPYMYKGRNLRVSHRALKISNTYFDIAMNCVEQAFKQNGVDSKTLEEVCKHFETFRADVTNKYKVDEQDADFFEKYYNQAWMKQVKKDEEEESKKKKEGKEEKE